MCCTALACTVALEGEPVLAALLEIVVEHGLVDAREVWTVLLDHLVEVLLASAKFLLFVLVG